MRICCIQYHLIIKITLLIDVLKSFLSVFVVLFKIRFKIIDFFCITFTVTLRICSSFNSFDFWLCSHWMLSVFSHNVSTYPKLFLQRILKITFPNFFNSYLKWLLKFGTGFSSFLFPFSVFFYFFKISFYYPLLFLNYCFLS